MPESNHHDALPPSSTPPASPWSPLRIPLFRNLLIADLVSDIGTFMQTVGAAWLMTMLTPSPIYIALIQTASALPFFLLALPAGSIGDIVDRRKLILFTETWMLVAALVLAGVSYLGAMTPWLLLVLTLALSLGDAVESPTWRAIFPELVAKNELNPALALNGIEFNLARATGPGLAGVIVAAFGVATAFFVDAFSFLGVIFVIFTWKRPAKKSRLPAETLGEASVAAIRYVRYSPGIRTVLVRSGSVIFFASSFFALLPAVAKELTSSPLGYGFLLAFFGIGAVLGAVLLQRATARYSTEAVLSVATLVFGATLVSTATLHHLILLCALMLFGGAAWTVFMSMFNTMIQELAPEWVRARVMAAYLFVFQGSVVIGSTLWGFLAQHSSSRVALLASGIGIGALVLLQFPLRLPNLSVDLSSWNHWGNRTPVRRTRPHRRPGSSHRKLRDPSGESASLPRRDVSLPTNSPPRRRLALGNLLRHRAPQRLRGDLHGGFLGRARTPARPLHRRRSRNRKARPQLRAGANHGEAITSTRSGRRIRNGTQAPRRSRVFEHTTL